MREVRQVHLIFVRGVVHVETDHKPLEEIFKKSLCDAPAHAVTSSALQPRCQIQGRPPHANRGYAEP